MRGGQMQGQELRDRERGPFAAKARKARPGFIFDYISGAEVRDKPEETEAVQVFARRLVEDYGYDKELIQAHPQYGVRFRPSDEGRSFPVDIAVFTDPRKRESDLFLVVECKQRKRADGLAQLKLYLDMSEAEIGVWFNGDEHLYIRKVLHRGGRRTYLELPNIPRKDQRIEDIGLYRRKELKAPSNLKAVFRDLRNHLAGMTTGISHDLALAPEIINLLFCKIYDEQETAPDDIVSFRAGVGEYAADIRARIHDLFEKVKNTAYGDVFRPEDKIRLDDESIRYVVGELQNYCVMDADRDAIGDAFEVFIGPALRGSEGQFFTPRNVVKMIVDIIDPKPGEKIIDPACGSGGFLIGAYEHVRRQIRAEGQRKRWTEALVTQREIQVATDCFRGIDKDEFLSRVSKAYMALIGDGRGGIFCDNSLAMPTEWKAETWSKIGMGQFDVVLTNPPFGSKIAIKGDDILGQYTLGRRWKKGPNGTQISTQDIVPQRPPQVLFIERCLDLLKPGGRMGIVIPESILGNPSYNYLLTYLQSRATIIGIVTLPEALFKTSGKGGTHTKVAAVFIRKEPQAAGQQILMSEVRWCGHDSRGNPTYRADPETGEDVLLDEVPLVPSLFAELSSERHGSKSSAASRLAFEISSDDIRNNILVPKYYDPEIDRALAELAGSHDLPSIGELIDANHISVATGDEVGKMAYGTGAIPFIRTSDISNWEVKADFKHGVSEAIYQEYRAGCDVQANDILMVRDGTYLIGTVAMVTQDDLPMLYQSHILNFRVLKDSPISPWLLLTALTSPIVKRQVRANQFTQDIIDTLGKRFREIRVPIPRDDRVRARVESHAREVIEGRAALQKRAKRLSYEVQGVERPEQAGLDDLPEEAGGPEAE